MKRQVRVFIEGQQLDLFNDEQIQVNSAVQDVYDISKTKTDMSQSFTVPGSAKNNQIFEHFYENAVDGTLDYGLRRDGYIEIDLTTFRKGRISLEKANLTNGKIDNYTITFYGELTSLKDKFGDDKLKDLDYSMYEHDWTLDAIVDRIDGTVPDPDVAWPLITSNRLWEYDGAQAQYTLPNWLTSTTSNNDIHTGSGAIDPKAELFPAIRLNSIMRLIEQKYAITFNSNFFVDERFVAAYLWLRNKNVPSFSSAPQAFDITGVNTSSFTNYDLSAYVSYINNSIQFVYLPGAGAAYHQINFSVQSVSGTGIVWYIDVYRNGVFFNTIDCLDFSVSGNVLSTNVYGLDETYTFQMRSEQAANIDVYVIHSFLYFGATMVDYFEYTTATLSFVSGTNLASAAPDMKISDFFGGVLREFNLVCVASDVDTYTVEPLLDWYASGRVYDITRYTDATSIEVAKVPLYKRIAFKYQTSESAMNKYYFQQWSKEYGNTDYQYPYDGPEYVIEVPFENLMFNKFTGTDLQIGYCLNSSLAPYIPKPLILYKYSNLLYLTTAIHYKDAVAGNRTAHNYTMFGQDYTSTANVDYSLNFAPETSTYHLYPIQQSLFATYYYQYLANLYNVKNRLTTYKTILPISLLTGLKLNDRVIIRDKRYIINDMNCNLVSGEVTLRLLNDFMPVSPRDIIPPLPED
jgi:hypothetical protein